MTAAAARMPALLPDARAPLDAATARAAFTAIMDGAVPDAALADFLVALADRGETVTEVAAAAAVLRERATTITAPAGAIDVVGTGGDGKHTLNVSTAVAIVVAACGVPVAKHGNRAASSKSGAADVLAELGVPTALEPDAVARCLDTLGITFLHAARHHGAMARVAGVRKALGRRTIFNLLGPLANPAGVSYQLIGVADPRWLRPFAEVLRELGAKRAMIVHGSDGIDELTVTGPSRFALLDNGSISEAEFTAAHEARKEKREEMREGHKGMAGHGTEGHVMASGSHHKGGRHGHKGGGMMMLKLADANGDKTITNAEMMAAVDAHFAKADSNKDGKISADEHSAMRKAMRAQMKAQPAQ
jgi:anthranilate phosphoribosyltransferase